MRLLIVSATGFEMTPLLNFLEENADKQSLYSYRYKQYLIHPLVTGVGSVNTALGLSRCEFIKEIDVAIQMGVAGAFDRKLPLGLTCDVVADRFADLGVEEADGSFTDVYELSLCPPDTFPFENGWLNRGNTAIQTDLPTVNAITVNKVHGFAPSIERIENKYKAQLESMEGAAFFYTCRLMDVKCVQIRSVSNYVEPRNRAGWQLELAIDNLNREVIRILNTIES